MAQVDTWQEIIKESALLSKVHIRSASMPKAQLIKTDYCEYAPFNLEGWSEINPLRVLPTFEQDVYKRLHKSLVSELERYIANMESAPTRWYDGDSRGEMVIFANPMQLMEMSRRAKWTPAYQLPEWQRDPGLQGMWGKYQTYRADSVDCSLIDIGHLAIYNLSANYLRTEIARDNVRFELKVKGLIGCPYISDFTSEVHHYAVFKP